MPSGKSKHRLAVGVAMSAAVAIYLVVVQPGYLTNVKYLGGMLLLEVLAAVIWNYRRRFFPVLILVFLFAGTDVPPAGIWGAVRWIVLGTGALAGMAIYLKGHVFSVQLFHCVALFCVAAAAVSAEVSSFPKQALLKALSLFLLFLYGMFGARLAIMRREEEFLAGLLLGCEALIYFAAVEYFILRSEFFGNPNSLGAVMGIVATPLMLWGILVSENLRVRRRRTVAFLLSLGLLLMSYARASIIAAAASCILLCILLRSYRTLMKGLVVALLMATVVASVVSPPNAPAGPATVSSRFLFKEKGKGGILSSRTSVWDSTISSIEDHPWFGIGFGTARSSDDSNIDQVGTFESNSITTREHGDSYLAIVEGVGIFGVLPFFGLVLLTGINSGRVLIALWHTRNPFSPAVPIAIILVAGLVHALFEDWLFAAGSYLCVFFWSLAFILLDLFPVEAWTVPEFDAVTVPREEVLVSPGI